MKRHSNFRLTLFLCFVLFLSFFSLRASAAYSALMLEWNRPMEPFRIVDDVYYVGAENISSFLIKTSDGLILIDSGLPETAPQILANIERLGFKPEDLKFLIVSHGHYDHSGGLNALAKASKAQILAGEDDAAIIERGGLDDPQFGDKYGYPPVKVTRRLNDGDEIGLGGVVLNVFSTPGHTKGALTFTMQAKDNGKPCKVVFAGSVSCPDYKLVENSKYPDIVTDYEHTFKKMKEFPCDVFLAQHGSKFDLAKKSAKARQNPPTSPFVDAEGYKRYLAEAEKQFRELLAEQSKGNSKP
jgi:metallo-beta-lactamase class B